MNISDVKYWWTSIKSRGVSYPTILDDGNTVLWVDFEKGVTSDGSGLVSKWEDQSGNDNHLLQATGFRQPKLTETGILFDGANDAMKAAFTLEQPTTIYLLVKQLTWASNSYVFDASVNRSGSLYRFGTTPNLRARAGVDLNNANNVIDDYQVIRIQFNGASSKFQIDESTEVAGNAGSGDMNGITLGAYANEDALHSNIEVREVILRKISDTESNYNDVYEYLKKKVLAE